MTSTLFSSVPVTLQDKPEAVQSTHSSAPNPDAHTVFMFVFMVLIEAMTIKQHGVAVTSKELQQNAKVQNSLNNANEKIKFSILPSNATSATVQKYQDINESRSSQRANIQNKLMTAQQGARVEMTQASTGNNAMQQDATEDTGWLKALNTIFLVIDKMSPGNRKS